MRAAEALTTGADLLAENAWNVEAAVDLLRQGHFRCAAKEQG